MTSLLEILAKFRMRRNVKRAFSDADEVRTSTSFEKYIWPLGNSIRRLANSPSESEGHNTLNENLRRLRNVITPGALVYLLTDFSHYDAESERHLSQLAKHADVNVYWINDPLELSLPPQGQYPITDGHAVGTLNINSERLRREYEQSITERLNTIQSHLRKNRIRVMPLLTTSPWAEKLMGFLLEEDSNQHLRAGTLL